MHDAGIESDTLSCVEHSHQNSARRPFVWVANEATSTRCVREVQQQPLSLFNIPLTWAAAGNESRVLDRLVKTTEHVKEPVEFHV